MFFVNIKIRVVRIFMDIFKCYCVYRERLLGRVIWEYFLFLSFKLLKYIMIKYNLYLMERKRNLG